MNSEDKLNLLMRDSGRQHIPSIGFRQMKNAEISVPQCDCAANLFLSYNGVPFVIYSLETDCIGVYWGPFLKWTYSFT